MQRVYQLKSTDGKDIIIVQKCNPYPSNNQSPTTVVKQSGAQGQILRRLMEASPNDSERRSSAAADDHEITANARFPPKNHYAYGHPIPRESPDKKMKMSR